MARTRRPSERMRRSPTIGVGVLALLAVLLVLPLALAPRAEAFIYWTAGSPATKIGRASLDGTGVDPNFFAATGLSGSANGLAVDASHVYWTTNGFSGTAETIGRANLDGSGVDQSFITGIRVPSGIAVNADHVYWTELVCTGVPCTPAIGRANLDGTNVDHRFISGGADFQFGRWSDVAVDANFVYWTQGFQGGYADTIMRANLDGTGASTFIPKGELGDSDEVSLQGLAVDALTDTGIAGKISAAKTQKQVGRKIVVKAKAKAKEKLTAKARGKVNHTYKLKPKTALLATGQTATLKLKPKKPGQAKRIAAALKRGKKATAKLTVKLTDVAGNIKAVKLRVALRR